MRKIANPINTSKSESTKPGKIGILVNGVEILNYKSNDVVYYGPLSQIDVTSEGKNYDIINPPIISISDKTWILRINIDNKFKRFIVEKASIHINGVSLTISKKLKEKGDLEN